MNPTRDPLSIGRRYRITYRPIGARTRKETFKGNYLGWSKFYTKHEFDLRPDHGTTGLLPEQILECEEIR